MGVINVQSTLCDVIDDNVLTEFLRHRLVVGDDVASYDVSLRQRSIGKERREGKPIPKLCWLEIINRNPRWSGADVSKMVMCELADCPPLLTPVNPRLFLVAATRPSLQQDGTRTRREEKRAQTRSPRCQ